MVQCQVIVSCETIYFQSQAEEEDVYTESYESSQGQSDDIVDFRSRVRSPFLALSHFFSVCFLLPFHSLPIHPSLSTATVLWTSGTFHMMKCELLRRLDVVQWERCSGDTGMGR